MKVKVLKRFYDKTENLKPRELGDIFEADKERVNELAGRGFVKEVATKADTKTEKAN